MTTLRAIIGRAFRETEILGIEETVSAAQETEALPLLQGIIARSYTQTLQGSVNLGDSSLIVGAGQDRRDFTSFVNNYPLPTGIVLHCSLVAPTSIFLAYTPADGARFRVVDVAQNFATFPLTLLGNGARINNAPSAVLGTNGASIEYFYRREFADWITVSELGLDSSLPYPAEFDDKFVIELAGRISPRYGASMPEITTSLYTDINQRFAAQYRREPNQLETDRLFDNPFTGSLGGGFIS